MIHFLCELFVVEHLNKGVWKSSFSSLSLAPPTLKDVHLQLIHPFRHLKGVCLLMVLRLQSIVNIPCCRENLCAVKPWGRKRSKAEMSR